MFIYIAGRYSAESEMERSFNVETAMRFGVEVEKQGHHAVIPHLSHYVDSQARAMGVIIDYEKWIQHGLEQLSMCDAMLVISESPGVRREIQFAKERHIPIYYRIEDIHD
jgi:hypothetical protein